MYLVGFFKIYNYYNFFHIFWQHFSWPFYLCTCATMHIRVSVFMFALHYDGILQVYVCEAVGVEWEPQFL